MFSFIYFRWHFGMRFLPFQWQIKLADKDSPPNHGLITASAFVQNGKFAVIGTYDGRVIFYSTDQLKYFTQIQISVSSSPLSATETSRRKRRKQRNSKVTGIESVDETKILVTTNDSRIRLYDLRDLSLVCKYKGVVNYSSQIKATLSPDFKYIICGSENSSFYIWRVSSENPSIGSRRDRNQEWESVRLLPGPYGMGKCGLVGSFTDRSESEDEFIAWDRYFGHICSCA